ncbi:MAG: hypothetical protein ACRBFS_08235 [Aureispira sp.]
MSFNNDYYTHFDDYERSISFTEYLDFLIQFKGIKILRKNQDAIKFLDEDLKHWPEEFYIL